MHSLLMFYLGGVFSIYLKFIANHVGIGLNYASYNKRQWFYGVVLATYYSAIWPIYLIRDYYGIYKVWSSNP